MSPIVYTHKELQGSESKFLGLTCRQWICLIIAVIIGIPVFVSVDRLLGAKPARYAFAVIAGLAFCCGFINVNNMHAEKWILFLFRNFFVYGKGVHYKSSEEILQEEYSKTKEAKQIQKLQKKQEQEAARLEKKLLKEAKKQEKTERKLNKKQETEGGKFATFNEEPEEEVFVDSSASWNTETNNSEEAELTPEAAIEERVHAMRKLYAKLEQEQGGE